MLELIAPFSPGPDRSPTVLLVDGDALYRWFVTEALSASGTHVESFTSMADAAACLVAGPGADLVLVDCQTLIDEGAAGRAALARSAAVAPCLLLASADPAGSGVDAPGTTMVQKPVDLGLLVAVVAGRLGPERSAGLPSG